MFAINVSRCNLGFNCPLGAGGEPRKQSEATPEFLTQRSDAALRAFPALLLFGNYLFSSFWRRINWM